MFRKDNVKDWTNEEEKSQLCMIYFEFEAATEEMIVWHDHVYLW